MLRESGKRLRHAVYGVGELSDLAFRFDKELLLQIAIRDRGNNSCNTAHLIGQIAGHGIHAVRQIFPRPANSFDRGLSSQPALRADFARDARHFRSERIELIHHRIDSAFELKNFAFYVDRDLFRQIASRDRRRHLGNIANLTREIACHRIHTIGQVFPGPGYSFHLRLTA